MQEIHIPTKTMYNMENFKNIILLLNSQETREVGAFLAVGQGLEKKVLAFYEIKRHKTMINLNKVLRIEKKSNNQYLRIIERLNNSCLRCLSVQVSIRDAMHDKEVFELVQSGKMKESERLPF